MEKYDVENHLFYDGYKIDPILLRNPQFVENLLGEINKYIFRNNGKIQLIPYFNGKVKEDGGVSGIILGDGFHFTCHTFCYKGMVFVDYFGDDSEKGIVQEILLDYFDTDDYDMGSKDITGNFGKHIIVHPTAIQLPDAKKLVVKILKEIEMTPITSLIVNKYNEDDYDVLQPIAESHISFHKNKDNMVIDAFLCKNFDVQKFVELTTNESEYIEVNRGLRYK